MEKIYAGSGTNLTSIPFSNLKYVQKAYDIDTVSFKSPVYLAQGSDIRVLGNFPTFGGKINNINSDGGIYTYEANSYEDLLRGGVKASFIKKSSSYIIKNVLKAHKIGIGGIKNTKSKHASLIFKNVSALDICHQIATLQSEFALFYVNSDRIGVFKKLPSQYMGIVLKPGNYADSSVTSDTANIITAVKVYGKKDANKLLFSYKNKKLIAKYGVITEIIMDEDITTKSKAKKEAKVLFKKEAHAELEAVVIIPAISEYKKLQPNQYMVLYDRFGKWKKYWIEKITNNKGTRELKLLSDKADLPDSWTYKPPSSNKSNCTTTTKGISPPKKVHGSCNACKYNPMEKNTFENKCPCCGKKGKMKFNYGHKGSTKYTYINQGADYAQFTCDNNNGGCGADLCAKCGKEKYNHSKKRMKKITGSTSSSNCTFKSVKGVAKEISQKAQELGTARKIFNWVDQNIKYGSYYGDKKTDLQTFKQKKGNCYDQAQLLVTMLKCINIIAKLSGNTYCNGIRHNNVIATVNGKKIIMDPTCRKPKNANSGSWTKRY